MSEPKSWFEPEDKGLVGKVDQYFYQQTSPHPFIPGARLSAGRFWVPVKILMPLMLIVGAITLGIFGLFIGAFDDPTRPSTAPFTAETRMYVVWGLAGLTFVLAVSALAVSRVRGWLGLAALATFAAGFAITLMWFGQ